MFYGVYLVGVAGAGDGVLYEPVHVDARLDALAQVQALRRRVQQVVDLLVVDLQERALQQKLLLVPILK